MWRLTAIGMAVMAQTKAAAEGQSELQALLGKISADPTLSLDTLYMLTVGTTQMPNMPSDFKQTMLGATLDILSRRPRQATSVPPQSPCGPISCAASRVMRAVQRRLSQRLP